MTQIKLNGNHLPKPSLNKPEFLLQVQWFFGQKLVPLSRRVTSIENDAEYGLHFRKVHETDFGIYTCLAKNSIGFGLGYVELSGNFSISIFHHP